MQGAYGSKHKKIKKKKGKGHKYGNKGIKASSSGHKRKHEKRGGKKSRNINCFNYGKPGHFTHNCTEPKVMFNHNHPFNLYISNCLIFVESVLVWTVD